jgi:PIN domain nuclease of toxin-antitoxin system
MAIHVVADTHTVLWYLYNDPRLSLPDRIVAATALRLGVPVVSRDRKIRSSIVTAIW